MNVAVQLPSPLVELRDERITAARVRLLLKRDDLIHPELTGNKWRKLRDNLTAAKDRQASALLTFGGAYSNHIRAVAAAGRHVGLDTIGVIRGEEHLPLNPSLQYAVDRGMRLTYLDRSTYRSKNDSVVIEDLRQRFGDFYLIPEGGSNALALPGCAELVAEIDEDFNVICCACGTGGTLAGIAAGLREGQTAIGFSALKGGSFLRRDIADLQVAAYGAPTDNWEIELCYHFGGFAKSTPELNAFIDDFQHRHGLRLEWVYVAKMLFGVFDLVAAGRFAPDTTIIAVITGPAFDS